MIGYGQPLGVHLFLWLFMIIALVGVRAGLWRDTRARRRDDRVRLRAGLIAELRALRAAYRINTVFGLDEPVAMSGRPFFTMFRGNMAKVLLLTEAELAALIRCHAASEALDEAVALHARTGKHRGRVAAPDVVANLDLRRMHRAARGNCRIALEVLSAAAAAEAARDPWHFRLWRPVSRYAGFARTPKTPAEPPAAEVIRLPPPSTRAGSSGAA